MLLQASEEAARPIAAEPARPPIAMPRPYISLFWRIFIPNALVILGQGVWRWAQPANGEVLTLATTAVAIVVINLLLMRRSFAPLEQLNASMQEIRPPAAGRRIEVKGPESEVTRLAHTFNDMLDRLETERRDSARRAMQAQEEERRRIAVELHDGLGQDLTGLILEMRAIAADSPAAVATRLRVGEARAQQVIEDVRRLARQLRPEALDELGLVPALTALCNRISGTAELEVRFEAPRVLNGLGADQELMIYRVAQESLTNAVRHADARRATVRLDDEGDAVALTVEDDGHGLLQEPQPGGGISGMLERAILNGAQFAVEPAGDGGVRVRLRVLRARG